MLCNELRIEGILLPKNYVIRTAFSVTVASSFNIRDRKKKVLEIFFELCPLSINLVQAFRNRLQKKIRKSIEKMVLTTYFDFRLNRTIYGRLSIQKIQQKSFLGQNYKN